MSKIKLTGSNSGYVEIDSAADAGNLTLALPTAGTALLSNAGNVFSGITTFTGVNITDDITFNGASYNVLWDKSDNQLEFGDNAKLSFGGSSDMQLYHDGNNSFIKDSGTGDLLVNTSQMRIKNAANNATMAIFSQGGRVQLWYNNSAKFETTNTGAVVTGICTATSFSGSGENLTRTTQYSHRNIIINGEMSVSQRHGTSETTPAHTEFGPDRMRFDLSQSSKFKVQQVTDAPAGFSHSMKVTSLSAYSSGANDYFVLQNMIEGTDSARLNWGTSDAQTVTLSFYVKSSLTGVHACGIRNNAYNRANTQTYTINNANTWERKTVTFTGDTSGSWNVDTNAGLKLNFDLGSGSNFQAASTGTWLGTNDFITSNSVKVVGTNAATWYITGIQLELGDIATPFEHRSLGEELARCQRYYYVLANYSDPGSTKQICNAMGYSTVQVEAVINFPTVMRSSPSLAQGTGSSYMSVVNANGQIYFNSWVIYHPSPRNCLIYQNSGLSGSVATGASYRAELNNANAYVHFDAEI